MKSSVALSNATESQKWHNSPSSELTLDRRLAARGFRLTAKRKALLKILENAGEHLDAAALQQAASQETRVDRATVYRTLRLLKSEGLIDELDLLHLHGEMHYYEARTNKEHFHIACLACGRIEEIEDPLFERLKREVSRKRGFEVETARLEIGGYCADCLEKRKRGLIA